MNDDTKQMVWQGDSQNALSIKKKIPVKQPKIISAAVSDLFMTSGKSSLLHTLLDSIIKHSGDSTYCTSCKCRVGNKC